LLGAVFAHVGAAPLSVTVAPASFVGTLVPESVVEPVSSVAAVSSVPSVVVSVPTDVPVDPFFFAPASFGSVADVVVMSSLYAAASFGAPFAHAFASAARVNVQPSETARVRVFIAGTGLPSMVRRSVFPRESRPSFVRAAPTICRRRGTKSRTAD